MYIEVKPELHVRAVDSPQCYIYNPMNAPRARHAINASTSRHPPPCQQTRAQALGRAAIGFRAGRPQPSARSGTAYRTSASLGDEVGSLGKDSQALNMLIAPSPVSTTTACAFGPHATSTAPPPTAFLNGSLQALLFFAY